MLTKQIDRKLHGSYREEITRTLQWRHNARDGVSNHQPRHCLLNRLFRRRSKKTSKLSVTGLCAGDSPVNSPHKGPVTRKMFPFGDVIIRSILANSLKPRGSGLEYIYRHESGALAAAEPPFNWKAYILAIYKFRLGISGLRDFARSVKTFMIRNNLSYLHTYLHCIILVFYVTDKDNIL